MRISDWSSDVCSSDLRLHAGLIWPERRCRQTDSGIERPGRRAGRLRAVARLRHHGLFSEQIDDGFSPMAAETATAEHLHVLTLDQVRQNGRASGRERVGKYV